MKKFDSLVSEYLEEGVARASGRWYDFENIEKVWEGRSQVGNVGTNYPIKVYKGERMGKTIYETQIRHLGYWKVSQYSSSFEEAKNPIHGPWR